VFVKIKNLGVDLSQVKNLQMYGDIISFFDER
jgi:hypothetical protein